MALLSLSLCTFSILFIINAEAIGNYTFSAFGDKRFASILPQNMLFNQNGIISSKPVIKSDISNNII